jgi:hypothetical protein
MDDCSGNIFKRITENIINKMPKELAGIWKEYNVDPDFIKNKLYKEPNPNAYFSHFALLIHKDTEFARRLF